MREGKLIVVVFDSNCHLIEVSLSATEALGSLRRPLLQSTILWTALAPQLKNTIPEALAHHHQRTIILILILNLLIILVIIIFLTVVVILSSVLYACIDISFIAGFNTCRPPSWAGRGATASAEVRKVH